MAWISLYICLSLLSDHQGAPPFSLSPWRLASWGAMWRSPAKCLGPTPLPRSCGWGTSPSLRWSSGPMAAISSRRTARAPLSPSATAPRPWMRATTSVGLRTLWGCGKWTSGWVWKVSEGQGPKGGWLRASEDQAAAWGQFGSSLYAGHCHLGEGVSAWLWLEKVEKLFSSPKSLTLHSGKKKNLCWGASLAPSEENATLDPRVACQNPTSGIEITKKIIKLKKIITYYFPKNIYVINIKKYILRI